MTVVIDVGAARYGGDYSMERLIVQFEPTHLYAVDPNPALDTPAPEDLLPLLSNSNVPEHSVEIHLVRSAAWTSDGKIGFREDGLNSWVTFDINAPQVPCFDLGRFITELDEMHNERLILKLDCEGAEYDLLPNLIVRGITDLLDLVIVEWHPKTVGYDIATAHQELIEERIQCDLQEWPY